MLTKDIRKTIDNARDILVGKIPNPQSQIEQITIAMIYKFMDDMDIESVELGGERHFFTEELAEYAWSKIMSQQLGNEVRMNLYTEALEKLPLSNRVPKLFRDIFKGAYLPFRDNQILTLFLKEINDLSYENSENLGNGFEYLLSIMGSQGEAGQFRTPRHIIDFIVDVVKPTKTDTILDPACGTAGFLISAYKYIQKCTAEKLLSPKERMALVENIQGYDISPDMVKLALVNMYLHKFRDPKIYEYDTLTNQTRWDDYFDCILANPPFMTPKGGIRPHNKFAIKANRSEVLFVDYIMEHLNSTGRAGVIVPEGIVFQSANAYKELRKKLVEDGYLYAVVSLPSGIFQPYSGVKTSILFMDRQLAKKTDKVLFVEIQNDGFDLGAQRRPIEKNDLPKALELLQKWQDAINTQSDFDVDSKMLTLVDKSKLAENGEYNLTASRYKETQDYSNCRWEMVKLGEVCELYQPKTIATEELFENGNYCVYGANGIIGKYDEYNHEFSEVVITCRGASCGSVNITKPKSWITGNAMVVTPKLNQLCKLFLYYLLRNIDLHSAISGTAQPQITRTNLAPFKIPLPPLEVQEKIVEELDGYQAVIDGAQKVIDNWKPTFSINPEWEMVKLREVVDTLSGLWTGKKPPFIDINVIRNTNFKMNGYIDYSDIASIKVEKEHFKKRQLLYGDIIIEKSGGSKNQPVGRVVIFDRTVTNYSYSNFTTLLRIKDKYVINPFYLHKILYKYYIDGTTERFQTYTGGIRNLQLKQYLDIQIPLPPLEIQQEIVSKIEEEEKIVEGCKQLITLNQNKINTKIQSIWGDGCE